MATKTTQLPLMWELRTAEGEVLSSLYEDTVPQGLRDYVCDGETRRVYVQCTRLAPPRWVYPPPTFPEPQPIGRGGIEVNLTWVTGPEWRVGIYQKVGEISFDRDPLRWPPPGERIANQILKCTGIAADRDEVAADVRGVLRKMRARVPHAYPEAVERDVEEDGDEDCFLPDPDEEYVEVE
jgi:hypothetical protein